MFYTQLTILAVAIVFSVWAWRLGRPRDYALPTDMFFVAQLFLVGLPPFLNIRGESPFAVAEVPSDDAVERAVLSIAIMFFCYGCMWLMRRKLTVGAISRRAPVRLSPAEDRFSTALIGVSVALGLAMLVLPTVLEYRLTIARFLVGALSSEEYQDARRRLFSDDLFVNAIIGRLRYSLFAFVFALGAAALILKGRFRTAVVFAVAFYMLLGSSLGKTAMIVYGAYFAIIALLASGRTGAFMARVQVKYAALGLLALAVPLFVFYVLQYNDRIQSIDEYLQLLDLAVFRIFLAPYNAIIQFFMVYPHVMDFTYFADVQFVSYFLDLFPRSPDVEVATYLTRNYDEVLTSFPAPYVAGAYASYGFGNVVVFSLLTSAYMMWTDHIFLGLRSDMVRLACYATMLINVAFFAILAAPTTLLTYGCGVIPFAAWGLDRVVTRARRVQMVAHSRI